MPATDFHDRAVKDKFFLIICLALYLGETKLHPQAGIVYADCDTVLGKVDTADNMLDRLQTFTCSLRAKLRCHAERR